MFKLLKSNMLKNNLATPRSVLEPPFPHSACVYFLTCSLAHTHTVNRTGQCIFLFPVFHTRPPPPLSRSRSVVSAGASSLLSSARTRRMTRLHTAVCSSLGSGRRTRGAWADSCRCWRWAGAPGLCPHCGCRRPGRAPVCEIGSC